MISTPVFVIPGNSPRRLRRRASLVWIPGLLYVAGREAFFVDCVFYRFAEDPITARILLALGLKNVNVSLYPSVDAKVYVVEECPRLSGEDLARGREHANALLGQVELGEMNPARLALSHFLSPVKWIAGNMESIRNNIAHRVSASILSEILDRLEIVEKADSVPAYMLYGKVGKEIYVFFGGRSLRNRAVEAIVSQTPELEKIFTL